MGAEPRDQPRIVGASLFLPDMATLYRDAIAFYASLPDELDEWGRDGLRRKGLLAFANERRRLLHQTLDHALDRVERTTKGDRGNWP